MPTIKDSALWVSENEGWKGICAIAYVMICLFDFVVVPCWYGFTRPAFSEVMEHLPQAEVIIQMEYMKVLTAHHEPYTLKAGGLLHIAFGALLTGSAIAKRSKA